MAEDNIALLKSYYYGSEEDGEMIGKVVTRRESISSSPYETTGPSGVVNENPHFHALPSRGVTDSTRTMNGLSSFLRTSFVIYSVYCVVFRNTTETLRGEERTTCTHPRSEKRIVAILDTLLWTRGSFY